MAFVVKHNDIEKSITDFQIFVRDTFGIKISKENVIRILLMMKSKEWEKT